ncbi:hypothetical protein D3C72_1661300 [compost metagenome]
MPRTIVLWINSQLNNSVIRPKQPKTIPFLSSRTSLKYRYRVLQQAVKQLRIAWKQLLHMKVFIHLRHHILELRNRLIHLKQNISYTIKKMLAVQGLNQIILGSKPKGHLGILKVLMSGYDDSLKIRLDHFGLMHQFNSIHGPHLNIGHKQINLFHPYVIQSLVSAVSGIHLPDVHSRGREQALQPLAN